MTRLTADQAQSLANRQADQARSMGPFVDHALAAAHATLREAERFVRDVSIIIRLRQST